MLGKEKSGTIRIIEYIEIYSQDERLGNYFCMYVFILCLYFILDQILQVLIIKFDTNLYKLNISIQIDNILMYSSGSQHCILRCQNVYDNLISLWSLK